MTDFTISLRMELNRYGAVHVIASTIPDVSPEDSASVRDELLSRQGYALRSLTDFDE